MYIHHCLAIVARKNHGHRLINGRDSSRLPWAGCLEHNLLVWSLRHLRGSQEPTSASLAEDQLSTPARADLAAVPYESLSDAAD